MMGFRVTSLLNLYLPSFSLFLASVMDSFPLLVRLMVLQPRTKAYILSQRKSMSDSVTALRQDQSLAEYMSAVIFYLRRMLAQERSRLLDLILWSYRIIYFFSSYYHYFIFLLCTFFTSWVILSRALSKSYFRCRRTFFSFMPGRDFIIYGQLPPSSANSYIIRFDSSFGKEWSSSLWIFLRG